jgi:Gene product 88
MVRISVTSKLDGIRSWSLQALDTCPGSKAPDGSLVDACSGCYATTGNYVFDNVKAPRLHNREDWQRDAWVSDMVKALDADRYFRWFDSGDVYALELAEKILEVMTLTPWVKHWMPTRMFKFAKFRPIIAKMQALPNVSVRFSSDAIDGTFSAEHGSTIGTIDVLTEIKGLSICHAYDKNGKCSGCRTCWDKTVPVVGYVAHGRKMTKVINIKKA